MRHERAREVTRAHEQIAREHAEHVRVRELKQMLNEQHLEWLAQEVALDDVMQMSHGEERRRQSARLSESEVTHQEWQHARAKHELFGERTHDVVAPEC